MKNREPFPFLAPLLLRRGAGGEVIETSSFGEGLGVRTRLAKGWDL